MIMQSTREATREELIQRINELQNENKFLRDENNIYRNETVSKSVIRNKIEELEKGIIKLENKKLWNEPFDTIKKNRFVNHINILKELLGE